MTLDANLWIYSKNREIRIQKCTENRPNLAVSESHGILSIELYRQKPNGGSESCRISQYSEYHGAESHGFYCISS